MDFLYFLEILLNLLHRASFRLRTAQPDEGYAQEGNARKHGETPVNAKSSFDINHPKGRREAEPPVDRGANGGRQAHHARTVELPNEQKWHGSLIKH